MPGVLNGAGFVHVNVSGVSGQYPLIGAQRVGNDGGVALCASDKKVYGGVRIADGAADGLSCFFAVRVFPVAYGLFHIGFHKALENPGMCAFVVVALKLYHICKRKLVFRKVTLFLSKTRAVSESVGQLHRNVVFAGTVDLLGSGTDAGAVEIVQTTIFQAEVAVTDKLPL